MGDKVRETTFIHKYLLWRIVLRVYSGELIIFETLCAILANMSFSF